MRWLFRLIDWIRGPAIFRLVWHLLTGVSHLTEVEVAAASSVLGAGSIRYDRVRVAEGRVLGLLFKLNSRRAAVTREGASEIVNPLHARVCARPGGRTLSRSGARAAIGGLLASPPLRAKARRARRRPAPVDLDALRRRAQ